MSGKNETNYSNYYSVLDGLDDAEEPRGSAFVELSDNEQLGIIFESQTAEEHFDLSILHAKQDNLIESVKHLRNAAELGLPQAQATLGLWYYFGNNGLPKDHEEAARYFRLAADKGNVIAQHGLGGMYEKGEGGLPKDKNEALQYYFKAANQGYAPSQCNVALMHVNIDDLDPSSNNNKIALYYFHLASEQGLAEAQYSKGLMIEQGLGGLPKSDHKAAALYLLAADQGFAEAQNALARMNWLGLGIGSGGIPRSADLRLKETARLSRLAADQGHPTSQYILGRLYEEGLAYENGIQVSKNLEKAVYWYKLAADHGNEEAIKTAENKAAKLQNNPASNSKAYTGRRLFELAAPEDELQTQTTSWITSLYQYSSDTLNSWWNSDALPVKKEKADKAFDKAERIINFCLVEVFTNPDKNKLEEECLHYIAEFDRYKKEGFLVTRADLEKLDRVLFKLQREIDLVFVVSDRQHRPRGDFFIPWHNAIGLAVGPAADMLRLANR